MYDVRKGPDHRPGSLPVAKLTGETINAFQAVLRRCREHGGRPFVVHGGEPHLGEVSAEQAAAILAAVFAAVPAN